MQRVPLASLDALKGQGKQMPNRSSFRLNRSGLLLALISAAFAGQAQAAAGRVEFAIGPVSVVGADGRARPASRGTEVDTGDTVRTQQNGRVQVRMADGAYISLQPNTEFGIKDYRFAGKTDGSENAFYSLLKGAMRTVTGLIGRVNRNKYLVSTPTATVGIRGTGGVIQVQDDGSTLVQGTSGIWFLANPSGTIDIPAGVSGVAPSDPNQPPQETSDVPTSGPAPLPPQQEFTQGEQREGDGTNVITSGVLTSGDGYITVLTYGINCDGPCPQMDAGTGSATFTGSGQMTQFVLDGRVSEIASLQGGTHADFGTDSIIAWGRWIGTVDTPRFGSVTFKDDTGLHYVVGMPTPTMPTSGTASYSLIGATRPTLLDGGVTPGTFNGSLLVDFGATTPSVTMNLNVAVGTLGYSIVGSAGISGSTFSGFYVQGEGVTPTTQSSCTSSCTATVQGFFAGPNAERAGLGYHIEDQFVADVLGTAAFTKQ
jgi:hypothetical protein